jgi:mRNA interferase MazF
MISRGFIYWVDPGASTGREERKRRPYLVLSINSIASKFGIAIAIPGTTSLSKTHIYPRAVVRVSKEESGMNTDSHFLCFQIRALDVNKFRSEPAGAVSPDSLRKIEEAVKHCLGFGF